MTMNAAIKIDRIDPTDWYVGMKNPSLQLMVYGQGVREADVETDYPGVKIDSIVRLDSPNYLLVYLNLSGAQPGEMTLNFSGKKVEYQLKRRDMSGDERMGFTNADVLYMLMPDRFASGSTDNDQIKGLMPYKNDRTQPSLRHGGDLEGIRQHLDYFKQLGVTALWFTPVLENNSPDNNGNSTYHGYATTDYYKVDPRFGTNEEYRRLTDEAHQKGLKVVMDMIFNDSPNIHKTRNTQNTSITISERMTNGCTMLSNCAAKMKYSKATANRNIQIGIVIRKYTLSFKTMSSHTVLHRIHNVTAAISLNRLLYKVLRQIQAVIVIGKRNSISFRLA